MTGRFTDGTHVAYEFGRISSKTDYINGIKHGIHTLYYIGTEMIESTCEMEYGQRHGVRWEYDRHGDLTSMITYSNGVRLGKCCYFFDSPRGRVASTSSYIHGGKMDGLCEWRDSDCMPIIQFMGFDGSHDGEVKHYDIDGSITTWEYDVKGHPTIDLSIEPIVDDSLKMEFTLLYGGRWLP